VDKEIESEKKDKPVLNEELLGKLLEAAYVLQEHNRRTHKMELGVAMDEPAPAVEAAAPDFWAPQTSASAEAAPISASAPLPAQEQESTPDYTATLAQIVETQRQIQLRDLKLQDVMMLVAERVREIAGAGGSAIATVKGKRIVYRAANGDMALAIGTEVSMEKALCAACVRTGQVIRGANINAEFLVDSRECQRRGIQSMIAVPVYHEGEIAGALELYYASRDAYTEQDIHTCQLMAGLVTEAMARDEEASWKQSLASERAVVLKTLERPNPGLLALEDAAIGGNDGAETSAFICRKCGHQLVGEEKFCGKCGTARPKEYATPSMQPAVRWPLPETTKQATARVHNEASLGEALAEAGRLRSGKLLAESLEQEMPELFATNTSVPTASSGALVHKPIEITDHSHLPSAHPPLDLESDGAAMDEGEDAAPETSLAPTEPAADWSSAASARAFLQQLAAGRPDTFARFWRARRGDIYLAVAGILVAVVIGWGIRSDHSVGAANAATASHRKAPDADLSVFDRMLISLGLAEAPQEPESKGNPDTQVWVDLHTALYYCPGTDLYGKTPKGKFTTQRDAQLDQFEPAYRKACE
jgi:putative methionine-R-sulfoxide reductase with GAF domain